MPRPLEHSSGRGGERPGGPLALARAPGTRSRTTRSSRDLRRRHQRRPVPRGPAVEGARPASQGSTTPPEERFFAAVSSRMAAAQSRTVSRLEELGFFACEPDLEAELIRALATPAARGSHRGPGRAAVAAPPPAPAGSARPHPWSSSCTASSALAPAARALRPALVEALDLDRVPRSAARRARPGAERVVQGSRRARARCAGSQRWLSACARLNTSWASCSQVIAMPPCSCTVSEATWSRARSSRSARPPRAGRGPRHALRRLLDVRRGGRRRAPGGRPRRLDEHEHVGHPVLERLERADRPAELHPLLAVGDRHVQARCAAPTWSALVSAQATSRSGPSSAAPVARPRPREMVWSRAPTFSTSGETTVTLQFVLPQHDRGRGAVEHELAGDQRGDLTGGDPGQQSAFSSSEPPTSSAAVAIAVARRGVGREVASELLEDDGRLDERGPEAVVLLGDRPAPPRRSARTAPAIALRRTRSRTPWQRAPPRCRCACRAVTRTIAASSSCSSVRAKCIRPSPVATSDPAAVVRRIAPRADQGTDPVDPQAQVELGGVADRAVHLQRDPGGEVRRVAGGHLGPGHVARLASDSAAPCTSGRAKSRAIRTSASWCLIAWNDPMVRPYCLRCCDVVDRVGQQPFAAAEQLCGRTRGVAVERSLVERLGAARPRTAAGSCRPRRGPSPAVPLQQPWRRPHRAAYGDSGGAAAVTISPVGLGCEGRRTRSRARQPAGGRAPRRPRRGRPAYRPGRRRPQAAPARSRPGRPAASTASSPGSWSPSAQARAAATSRPWPSARTATARSRSARR